IVKTPVIDHLIISTRSYLSFDTIGLLDKLKDSTKYVPTYQLIQKIREEAAAMTKQKVEEAKETAKKREKAKITKIAKELKSAGMGIEPIAKLTGLSIEDVEKIRVRK
ncbi:MAG: hypothetical protein JKY03_07840, partial [Aureispira sp.]|nr:hypothetical protein [Aureispira sp.]